MDEADVYPDEEVVVEAPERVDAHGYPVTIGVVEAPEKVEAPKVAKAPIKKPVTRKKRAPNKKK